MDTGRKPAQNGNYILLSFANFTIPLVGRYEEEDEGGAYYVGDDDNPCTASDLYVNAWMPLPDPYRQEGEWTMLTHPERMNVKDRFSEYCRDKGIDETSDTMFDWLGMMDLLNEEAIKELPELKDKR